MTKIVAEKIFAYNWIV